MISKITEFFNSEKIRVHVYTFARVLIGYMFFLHGTAKFFEFPVSMTGGKGAVELFSMYGVAGILELVLGGLFIIGLFDRFAAFILSGLMAFAYFIAHANMDNFLFPIVNKGELALVYSLVFLAYAFTPKLRTKH